MKTLSHRRGIRARSIVRTTGPAPLTGFPRPGRTSLPGVCPFTMESLELCPKRRTASTFCAYSLEPCLRPA